LDSVFEGIEINSPGDPNIFGGKDMVGTWKNRHKSI